jgi:hypothetical protein
VVEVLKTINLIATADAGPGKTFFMLGMDWHYVLKAIEMHFEKFIGKEGSEGQFGREYLKKIVTLPVSVPKPSRTHIESFVTALDTGSVPEAEAAATDPQARHRWRARAWLSGIGTRVDGFAERPFNVVASVLVIAGLALGGSLLLGTISRPGGGCAGGVRSACPGRRGTRASTGVARSRPGDSDAVFAGRGGAYRSAW